MKFKTFLNENKEKPINDKDDKELISNISNFLKEKGYIRYNINDYIPRKFLNYFVNDYSTIINFNSKKSYGNGEFIYKLKPNKDIQKIEKKFGIKLYLVSVYEMEDGTPEDHVGGLLYMFKEKTQPKYTSRTAQLNFDEEE